MIPSTPRRTLLFLLLSTAVFFVPDWLVPEPWKQTTAYKTLDAFYLGMVILTGFALGPWMGRLMMIGEVASGPVRVAIDQALGTLYGEQEGPPAVRVFEHRDPFVLTAGLWPRQCEVFLSTGMVMRHGMAGLRFLLARAKVHATLPHRLAAVVPVLLLTVAVPDTPQGAADWGLLAVILLGWLGVHWVSELWVDRQAAALMGPDARIGLVELLHATSSRRPAFTLLPARWRERQMARMVWG
jgi:hypothetical protein